MSEAPDAFLDLVPHQVYAAGAPESGQQATPQQQAYAAAAAKFRDTTQPPGTVGNPSYDTASVQGDPASYHVTTAGQLSDPNPQVSGMFDDLMPGAKVQPWGNEGLGLEKGLSLPIRTWMDRAAASPLASTAVESLRDAFPEFDAGVTAADRLSKLGMSDVNAREARGEIPGKMGQFLGNTALVAPIPGGPVVSGLLGGALLSDKTTPTGIGLDMALGGVGGKLASSLLGGATHVISPNIDPAVQTLIDAKVPVTAGQILGGTAKRLEDGMTSFPMVGDVISQAKKRSLEGLNLAVANRALEPVGETVPANIAPGREAMTYAGDTLSDRYNALLPTLTVKTDPQFGQDLSSIASSAAQTMPADQTKLFGRFVSDNVLSKFDPQTGIMPPEAMKDAETALSQRISRYRSSPVPADQDMADALESTRQSLRDLVSRGNPQAASELQALNKGWANLVIGENATGSLGAHEGLFTPAQLASAVKKSDGTVRDRGYARGTALMQDLSDAALSRLPSSVPDSGSPFRHALEAGVAALVGKEAGMGGAMVRATGAGSILAAPYTKTGQPITQELLAGQRPAIAPHIAAILNAIKPIARGAGTALPLSLMQSTNGPLQ